MDMAGIPVGGDKPITVVDIKLLVLRSLELAVPLSLDEDENGCPDSCDGEAVKCGDEPYCGDGVIDP